MKIPSLSQITAFSQHAVSAVSGAIAYASLLHLFQNPGDAQVATEAVQHIGNGFKEIAGGVFALVPIGLGVFAAVKANPLVQFVLSATAMLHSKADASKLSADDQKTIMQATDKLPKVSAIVTTDKTIAAVTTEPGIISADQVVIKK